MRTRIALFIGSAVLVALTAAGATVAGPAPAGQPVANAKAARLQSFGTCGKLLRYAKRHASRIVGPYGFGGFPVPVAATPEESGARDAAPGVDFSTTNVQEAGVDEPDIVKTNGRHVFAIAQGKLQAVDVRGSEPRFVGSLALEPGGNHQLLLHENRLLVLSVGGFAVEPLPATETRIAPIASGSALSEIDISDPASMRVVRTLTVDGLYLNARLVGSTARVVLTSSPIGIRFVDPGVIGAPAAERRNRAAIASTRLRNWVPSYRLENRRTGRTKKGLLLRCGQVRRPPEFSGLGMLTVLTIDLARGLSPIDSDAVMTDGQIVYASPRSLYVATTQWVAPQADILPQGVTTALHKFDMSDAERTTYRASGSVPGFLLNQWSLSEHEGFLRVASTEQPSWWTGAGPEGESLVAAFDERDGKLVEVGRVGGLGKGERVYAVRFIGDVGYVVTFRQVDPLYTIDLSDPARPAVLGELKILGYSAYLHPLGDDLLLGVGQDATEEGRLKGTQVSVFDVSNLRRPARLHQRAIAQGSSEAEYDHHAFLYWPATRLAVLPIQVYGDVVVPSFPEKQAGFAGAVGFRVGRGALDEVGTVRHDGTGTPFGDPIRRSLVVGDTLYTVSESGLKASGLATLADRAWVSFGS